MIEIEGEFWQRVLDRRPPPPMTALQEAIARESEPEICAGELVRMDQVNAELAMTYANLSTSLVEAKRIKKDAEEFHDDVADRMKAFMEGNAFDVVEGSGIWTYNKEQAGKASFDKKALAADYPQIDIAKYEKRGKPYRTLRIFDKSMKLTEGGF